MCSRAYQQGDDSSLLYEQTKAYAKGRSAEQILIVPQNAEEGDGTDTLLKRVQTYIRNHYTERLTLADIAEAVHVSSSYLSRFYKLKDVRQRNTSRPEEEIYEKRNVGFTASYDGLSARRLQ